jgi:hypothetical protein
VLRRTGPAHAVRSMVTARGTSYVVTGSGTSWRLIGALLISGAAMDLGRCSLVLLTVRHLAPGIGLVAAGMSAAALSVMAARAYRAGCRWARLAAVLIGVGSAPLASASGFRAPFAIPDLGTAIVGIVLAVAVLATTSRGTPGHAVMPCAKSPSGQPCRARTDDSPHGYG